jgi:hypothetical protein
VVSPRGLFWVERIPLVGGGQRKCACVYRLENLFCRFFHTRAVVVWLFRTETPERIWTGKRVTRKKLTNNVVRTVFDFLEILVLYPAKTSSRRWRATEISEVARLLRTRHFV